MKWDALIGRAIVAVESIAKDVHAIAVDVHALRDAGYIMERGVSAQSRTARAIEDQGYVR